MGPIEVDGPRGMRGTGRVCQIVREREFLMAMHARSFQSCRTPTSVRRKSDHTAPQSLTGPLGPPKPHLHLLRQSRAQS